MKYEDARDRLFKHGMMTDPPGRACSWNTRLCEADIEQKPPDIDTLAADVLACLQTANREDRTRAGSELAFSVASIICQGVGYHRKWSRCCLFTPAIRDGLADAVHRIAFAWEQLLAGDADDLLAGIEESV